MALSTNSIIHYTKKIDSLKKILEEGFKAKYCYEKVLSNKKGYMHAAFPMVCFCDIPLSQVKENLDSYGMFGIGLRKEWAKQKGLSPVLYFDTDSNLIDLIRDEFQRLNDKMEKKNFEFGDIEHFIKILAYSKNYEADLTRNGVTIDNYRFYNEREWRYVPSETELNGARSWIPEDEYNIDKAKCNFTIEKLRLTFGTQDISYIIVEKDSDIQEITQTIRNLFSRTCTLEQMEILLTRIITTDQIKFDF